MAEDVKPFPPNKSLSALGINVRAPKISANLTLQKDSLNLSTGVLDGLGPRFGMAPIPNHSTFETPETGYSGGLAFTEEGSGIGAPYGNRRKVFGVSPTVTRRGSGIPFVNAYAWFLSLQADELSDPSTIDFVDLCLGQTSNTYPQNELAAGFQEGSTGQAGGAGKTVYDSLFFNAPTSGWRASVQARFQFPTSIAYASTAVLTVSGADIPAHWVAGTKRVNGSALILCTAYYTEAGFPTSWSTRDFQNTTRAIDVFDIDTSTGFVWQYTYPNMTTDSSLLYTEGFCPVGSSNGAANTVPASFGNAPTVTTRLDGAAVSASSVDTQLLNDPDMTINSGYTIYCAAVGGNPCAFITKKWIWPYGNRMSAPVDLTSSALFPRPRQTLDDSGAGTYYTENGTPRTTAFSYWPDFVSGTPLQTNAAAARTGNIHVSLGAANSGVLRANTEYEFTFSVFNKLTGVETNVGSPARFLTDTDDFVAISIYRDPTSTGSTGGTLRQRKPSALNIPVSNLGGYGNYMECRFYYRAVGSYEWLPALIIDLPKLQNYPNFDVLWACTGAIAALPGGQPGGFNDYSPLPLQDYNFCVSFKERMFWMTDTAIYWSYARNPFCYAGRNSASLTTGVFRGAFVHVNKGERAEDNTARLLMCTSDSIYVGRFTGQQFEQPVQVSPDTIESFPLEGSDFDISFWTSFTAFSARAMVVADGDLYYWGPNGVFFDEGVGKPSRISQSQEPDIFTKVDDTKIDQVFALYCDGTHEVFWFYPPAGGDGTTTGVLSYNTVTSEFQWGSIEGQVDGGQPIQQTKESIDWKGLSGQRSLLFVRADSAKLVQRAYYFDQRCLAGDVRPFADMLVYSAELISGYDWRLRLALGSVDNTNFATIAIGDYVSLTQFAAYTRSYATNTTDFVGLVVGTGNGGGRNYLDVRIPEEIGSLGSSPITFPGTRCPPIQHLAANGAGLNGFPWRIETNYWAAAGLDLEAFWKWLHAMFAVSLIPSRRPLTFSFAAQTPQRTQPYAVDYIMRNNFDGHYQTYLPMFLEDAALQSQAFKAIFSGYQIGSSWVLQYLAGHGAPTRRIDFLKEFEAEKA